MMTIQKKSNHLPERFGFQHEKAKLFPPVILLAGGSPCNLKCDGCPATHLPEIRRNENRERKNEPYFRFDHYKKLTDECAKHTSEDFHPRIRISGYGEPLLNKQLIEMIDYSCKRGVLTSLITNGLLLTQEKARDLIATGLESIEISVDAHNKELYSKIRMGGDFDVLRANVETLIEERNRQQPNRNTFIIASVVKNPLNHDMIHSIQAYWEKVGVNHVSIRKFLTWGVPELLERQAQMTGEETYLHGDSPCPYPFERLLIDPAGWIRLCPYDDQKKIPPFGHLNDATISEVWRGERLNTIRAHHHDSFIPPKSDKEDAHLCVQCEDRINRSWTHNYLSIAKKN